MLKYLFAFIMLIHGLIHCMGFAKAFNYGNITQLTKEISKQAGIGWLFAAFLFVAATLAYLLKNETWPYLAVIAAILSQILIVSVWKDARFGTIANIVVIFVAIAGWGSRHFEAQFRKDVEINLHRSSAIQNNLLTEADIQLLPQPVQKYLRYSGVINQPKVKNVKIVFVGEMRSKGKNWFKFQSVQYNFFDNPARLFFMKANMFGITVPGYHNYQNEKASMQVKLFGLFPVADAAGKDMNRAETVTLFNDMCLMAPATLIDKRIEWTPTDSLTAKATFTNGSNTISATLFFNQQGQLINFISDDRYEISAKKQYRFSTPVKEYIQINGQNCMKYGEAVWHYPEGTFVYGKFNLKSINYNVTDIKP
jgi:hypothetical protein